MMASSNYECREIGELEWLVHWPKVVKSNLMQSWEYGVAKSISEGWKPVRYLWEDTMGQPIALAQILTKSLPIIGGVARLNRGPLIIGSDPRQNAGSIKLELVNILKKIAVNKKWWLFYINPEVLRDDFQIGLVKKLNVRRDINPWASSRLSLDKCEDALLLGLTGKWRNLLRKAQKNNIYVHSVALTEKKIDEMIEFYENSQKTIGFSGISSDLLRCLCNASGPDWRLSYYVAAAEVSAEPCGIVVSIIHGDTATYLIGNTNSIGRELNANYLMLWRAILDAKSSGCNWYDLGGLNKNTSKGVAHFKSGLNGEDYELMGEVRMFPVLNR